MTSGTRTQRKPPRTPEPVPEDRFENKGAPAVAPSGIDITQDSEVLDDGAVADLLEGVPAFPPAPSLPSDSDVADLEPGGEHEQLATDGSVLVSILSASTLVISTTVAFAVVASRAPEIASILFVAYVVFTPIAVVTVLREEASSHRKTVI
jgi:hypothetical protein